MTGMSNLPPLPESEGYVHYPARDYEPEWTSSAEAYTAEQMYAYAQEAVRLERERLAEQWDGCICEGNGEDIGQMMREDAAIRARSQEGQG
jgi:hypothetical protein